MFNRFEEINSWQRGRELSKKVYEITRIHVFSKDYSLKDQIIRASNSIMLNIAEGFGRQSNKDFRKFLFIAHGSAAEVQSALYIALDQKYIEQVQFDELYREAEEISKLLSGLIKYLDKSAESS